MMADIIQEVIIPVPEDTLRELPKDLNRVIPNFSGKEDAQVLKEIQDVLRPLMDTADLADLSSSHRAAAFNALCAVIEYCQASGVQAAQHAVFVDAIWFRSFEIYLQRSDNAKSKSMRQMLLTLTGVLLRNKTDQSSALRDRATLVFLNIICVRQDRLKVKAALQGLAHLLLKDVINISELLELYRKSLSDLHSTPSARTDLIKSLFGTFLNWVVHHDTALSAGHLIKNFLGQYRGKESHYILSDHESAISPLWVEPVIDTLRAWPERIQEFKTHVFPHCFLPNINEFAYFLGYLHPARHVGMDSGLLDRVGQFDKLESDLSSFEEFKILLVAIQTGKELGIIKDIDQRPSSLLDVREKALFVSDILFTRWLSHPEPEARIAGLFLSVHSNSVTKPITKNVFKSLRSNLVHLHTDSDANFRREILSHTHRIFDRLRGSTTALARLVDRGALQGDDRIDFPIFEHRYYANTGRISSQDSLFESLSFINWYIHFLQRELRPTASYQRRITALRALMVVFKSGVDPSIPRSHLSKSAQGQLLWTYKLQLVDQRLVRLLLDLVIDPFDDVRNASIAILEMCLESLTESERKVMLAKIVAILKRAESVMLQSGRADQADGVARTYALLFAELPGYRDNHLGSIADGFGSKIDIVLHLTSQLEETISLASRDLSIAVNGRPVHGIFAAIRYIVDQDSFYPDIALTSSQLRQEWKVIHQRICVSFKTLWSSIQEVLCADAPEGHVPEDFEEGVNLDTKEILSYSWRGLKEASMLLRSIVSKVPIDASEASMLDISTFKELGRQSFVQLVEIRHRGAFATVAQTFAAFCRRCVTVEDNSLRELPLEWYQDTLSCIQDKASSITRRSAGIPSLMIGIIAAEPQPGGKLFARAMQDLMAEASLNAISSNIEESRLPQVHALNCLKDIYTSSKLSIASEAYIGPGLDIAAKMLNSNIWPIRNCSLMLFKALIERLLGSDEAQDWQEHAGTKTSRFSYENFPRLIDILRDLLDPNGPLKQSMSTDIKDNAPLDLHGAEGVFPALQILRQTSLPEENRHAFSDSVGHLLASPHWHLRDMAARTLVSLQTPHEYHKSTLSWLSDIGYSHNTQHGLLLALKYLLQKLLRHTQTLPALFEDILRGLLKASDKAYTQSFCPFTKSGFLDLMCLCGTALSRGPPPSASTLQIWSALTSVPSVHLEIVAGQATGQAILAISAHRWNIVNKVISLAQNSGQDGDSVEHSHLDSFLVNTSVTDPDTCSAELDSLGYILREVRGISLRISKQKILCCIYQVMMDCNDEEIRSKAQLILADSLLEPSTKIEFFKLVSESKLMKSLHELETQCLEQSPSNMQSSLRLLGLFLDHSFHAYPGHRVLILSKFAHYIRLLRTAIVDTNPFDLRLSAVQSISSLSHIWTASTFDRQVTSCLLGLSLVLYDLLNDDDDEIRDFAAATTARMFRAQDFRPGLKDTVAILTIQRLGKFIVHRFAQNHYLSKVALDRLGGAPFVPAVFITDFGATFAQERKEDTALFVQEKQNLFKDDTQDVVFWCHICKSLPTQSFSVDTRLQLTTWVLDALSISERTAKNNVDGPMGWSSKPEVFTLIMRVICTADVILGWNERDASKIRKALVEFADTGAKSDVHPLLLEQTNRILERSIVFFVRGISHNLISLAM